MCPEKLKSPNEFDSLMELVLYFSDEEKCLRYLEQWRWNREIHCPHCGMDKIYKFKDGRRFKCASCRQQFTAKVDTIFGSSRLPLLKWYMAMYLVGCHKRGISSYQLAKDIKVTQKTAWFMLMRIRQTFIQDVEMLEGVIQVDETFCGGINGNRHTHKKTKFIKEETDNREYKDKTPIIGLLTDEKKLKTIDIPTTKIDVIVPILHSLVKPGSLLITDEWCKYDSPEQIFLHDGVNHAQKNFVTPSGHSTNGIENVWTGFKKTISTYYNVSRKHLQRYADEVTFRYNFKDLSEGAKVNTMMLKVNNRLTYKNLVTYGKAQGYNNRECSQDR